MIERITVAFLERIEADAEFRAQIVKDADDEVTKRYSVTFVTRNGTEQQKVIRETALWKCFAALFRNDVLEALRARLKQTREECLSDGEIILAVRSVDPDLVTV